MQRIKELLHEWSTYQLDFVQGGFPHQVAFASERVQSSNRSTDTFREMPEIIEKLDREITRLAPSFVAVICMEYLNNKPQKTKAALLEIPRQVFNQRLNWIYEHLNFVMFVY